MWEIPTEITDDQETAIEPYFVTLPLPGEETPEFLLIQPFSPSTKNNMIGWMAARNDQPNYGDLFIYELPKQELIYGPIQIEGRIDQEPGISEQFSLWNQLGSSVIRGNLLVLPINNSFLYIEPVYLRSETSALPELKRVVVASNTSVAMAETLGRSLVALSRATNGTTTAEFPPRGPVTGGSTQPPTSLPADLGTLEGLISAANGYMEAAESAQRDGDWARYGQEIESLKATLERLAEFIEEVE